MCNYMYTLTVNTEDKSVSFKQDSGFTVNKNIEPITFRDDDSYVVKRPVCSFTLSVFTIT